MMEEMCSACLCEGRKLSFIADTGFYNLYTEILNEIPVYDLSQICVRICWECKSLLRRFQHFKGRVKHSYRCLMECSEQLISPQPTKPHLQTQQVVHITCPELDIKSEPHAEDLAADDDDTLVKSEELEHCEPETFVHNLDIELPKRKRASAGGKEKKEKPKKKLKAGRKAKIKKAPPAERKRQPSDAAPSGVSEPTEGEGEGERQGEAAPGVEGGKPVDKPNGAVKSVRKAPPKEQLPDKPQCVECGKMFSSKKTYRYHLNVLHKGQNRYPCPRCGKVYQWKSNLGRHMRSHRARDSGELYCETCDASFASVATYKQHLRTSRRHVTESEFSFMCNECGKRFVNKTRLRDHIDWEHLHKVKFRCAPCDKPFKCHTSLYVHTQNVHRNKHAKDNLCHVCGKSYQNAAKLKYHIVAMHTSETPYRCAHCGAAFGWYSSLYRHVREVHYKMKLQQKKPKKSRKSSTELPLDPPGPA